MSYRMCLVAVTFLCYSCPIFVFMGLYIDVFEQEDSKVK